MNRLPRQVIRSTVLVALTGALVTGAGAAGGSKLVLNGQVASNEVRVVNGSAYVKLSDLARALGMIVVKRGDGYEIKHAGGATPIQGVTQGKVGDVLFDGKWRLQVLGLTAPVTYKMKTDSEPYDFAGLTSFDRTNRIISPKTGYKLIVLQCRATNGQNSRQRLWTSISDQKMNTALADTQGASHPPVAYDYEGAPTQTQPLIPGAIVVFPVIFSIPQDTHLKDLIFTLHANGDTAYNDVRIALAGALPPQP